MRQDKNLAIFSRQVLLLTDLLQRMSVLNLLNNEALSIELTAVGSFLPSPSVGFFYFLQGSFYSYHLRQGDIVLPFVVWLAGLHKMINEQLITFWR